ncbi:neurofilament light polypeptide [Epinephelus moara]|uniref:neurofilament light polypeptide n=1 Tax=Epinephelus moara TaxID=300413 RepID=UPI00214E0000|nr:neurofilament light polypeptide [Epinephelus moara]
MSDSKTSNRTVLILAFALIGLLLLLIFLYKKLNRDTNGEYTVKRMVYKEGGVRDRVRGAALALESHLGVQLWPQSDSEEDGEEMQEIRDEEGQVEEGGSQGSDSEGEDQEEDSAKEKEGDALGDNSSVQSSEAGEQARLTDQADAKEEKEEKVGDGEGKGEASGGPGLLIDLKQFSGSAIWSEEEGCVGKDGDMTVL